TPQVSDRVLGIAIQPDGKILIIGDFQSVNGSFQSRKLARININGSLDTGFANALGQDIGDLLVKLQPDGKILVAGGTNHISRLNTDGSLDVFNVGGSGLSGSMSAIAIDGSNNILVG